MTDVLTCCLGKELRLLRGGGAISIMPSSEPESWLSLEKKM